MNIIKEVIDGVGKIKGEGRLIVIAGVDGDGNWLADPAEDKVKQYLIESIEKVLEGCFEIDYELDEQYISDENFYNLLKELKKYK